MYQKILLPLDGSKRAEAILPHVDNIAARFGAKVVVLDVEEPAIQLDIDEVINAERYLEERAQMRSGITAYASDIIQRFKVKAVAARPIKVASRDRRRLFPS